MDIFFFGGGGGVITKLGLFEGHFYAIYGLSKGQGTELGYFLGC